MHRIQLISLIALTGIIFGVRHLVLPSVGVLTSEQATVFMGKLMPKLRRALRVGVFLFVATEVYLLFSGSSGDALSWRLLIELALALAVTLIVLLLCISPHRSLALRIEPRRAQLLDVALALLIALLSVSLYR